MTEIDERKWVKLLQDYDKHCLRIQQATSVDVNEKPEAKLKRIKDLEKNYIDWFEYYFPNYAQQKSAKYHKELADFIINNKRMRLLAEIYRSGGKSVHLVVGIPLYVYFVLHELDFFLLMGETQEKAALLLSGIQSELEFNNRLKSDYGDKFQKGDWRDGNFISTDGTRFMSLGFGQNPRGIREQNRRPNYIAVDDVDSKKSINNDRIMRESVEYILEDILGTFDTSSNGIERFVFSNNNFHKNSITNRIREYFLSVQATQKQLKQKFSVVFKIIRVCAVKDLVNFEPTWPEKTTAQYWREKFQSTPYRSFMREFMHLHIQDGAVFKHEDILYCDPLPYKKYDALCLYGDLSYKANADYKALVLCGKIGKEFHVLHSYVRQKSRTDAAKWLYDLYEAKKLSLYNIRYLIEGLFAMDEFVNDFDSEGELRSYIIPVRADKKSKIDKFDRIESMSGFFEKHLVKFSNKDKGADQTTMIDQLLAFEKGSQAHDDAPDALQSNFAYLNKKTYQNKADYYVGQSTNHRY